MESLPGNSLWGSQSQIQLSNYHTHSIFSKIISWIELFFLKFTLKLFFKQAACWKLIVEIQSHTQPHFGHEFSKLSVPLCPVSPSAYCTPQTCSSSDVGLASSTQMWRLPLVGEGEPHTQALTRAGALLPLSLVLASATGLIAQVLEVHLHLLAVLLHRWSTCLGTDRACYRGSKFPTYTLSSSAAHTLALGEVRPRVG